MGKGTSEKEMTRLLRGKKLEGDIQGKEPSEAEMSAMFKGGKLPKKMR